jgi:hypothetical protein
MTDKFIHQLKTVNIIDFNDMVISANIEIILLRFHTECPSPQLHLFNRSLQIIHAVHF